MKHTFTKSLNILLLMITCLLAGVDVYGQAYTVTSLQTGGRYRALTRDNAGNIFMVRENAANSAYEVVKLPPDGSGAGTPLYSPTAAADQYPWGLAVNDNGDVFVTEINLSGWKITKLDAVTYTPHLMRSGDFYCALAFDNVNRLLTMEFDNRGDVDPSNDTYKLMRYKVGQENAAPDLLYDGIPCSTVAGQPTTYPWSIAVDGLDNIYIFDRIENGGGKLLKLSPPNYNVATTISSGKNISSLTVDAQNNVYTLESVGALGANGTYHIVKYTAPITGLQTGVEVPTSPATTLSKTGLEYPWGIVVGNTGNIFVNDGGASGEGRFLKLTPPLTVTSVTRASANPTNAASVTYTVKFSGNATNVTNAAFSLTSTGVTGPSVATVTGSGDTYTVTVNTGSGSGTIRLDVPGTGINPTIFGGTYTSGEVYTIDKTAPNTNIDAGPANPTNNHGGHFTFSVTPVESGVTYLAQLDGVGAFATVTNPYDLPATLTEGSHTLLVSAKDALGNTDAMPATWTWTTDYTSPGFVSLTSPANGYYRATQNLDFTVKYSENVTVTGTPSIGINIGGTTRQATYVSGSGSTDLLFRYPVVDGDNDMDGIGMTPAIVLNGGTIRDLAGNDALLSLGTAPDLSQVKVDTKHPTPTITTAATFPVTGAFTITVTFDEDLVDDLNMSDLGFPGVNVGPLTKINNRTWDIILTPLNGETNSSTVNVVANTVHDAAGNGNLSATTPLSISWDTKAPAITVTPPASKYYRAGDVVSFTISYDEDVVVTGAPTLPIIIDGNTRQAAYTAGANARTLIFNYTVAAGEQDLDGIDLDAQIALNGGSIKDVVGNNAVIGVANHYTGILIDGRPPTVASVTMPGPGSHNGYYINELGTPLVFLVNTSETVTVSGTPTLDVNIGGVTRQALYAGNIGNQLTFTYNIVDGDNTETGITLGANLNFPPGSSIRDAAGNNMVPALNSVGDGSGIKINTTHPDPTITPATASPYNAAFDISVDFDETVTDDLTAASFDITGGTITNLSTSDHKKWTVTITPTADAEGAGSVSVKANVVHNIATNGNTASAPYNFNYDTHGPAVFSRTHPANGVYRLGQQFTFTFTFDEDLVVTGTPILPLTIGGNTRNVPLTSSAGKVLTFIYTIVNGDLDLDGITENPIDLNGATIKDALNNNATLPTAINNYVAVLVDAVPPVVTSMAVPTPKYYVEGNPLRFTINTSENVVVNGSPYLNVNIGGVVRRADFSSGSGTTSLEFIYTVANGDNDDDGIEIVSPLELNGGTIRDVPGNDLVLTLNGVAPTNGVLVNTVIPNVTLSTPSTLLNHPFDVTITFTDAVADFDLADINFTNATISGLNTSDNKVFTVHVAPTSEGSVLVKIPPGAAHNIGTNPSPASNELIVFYDVTRPTVTGISATPGTYTLGDVINFIVDFSEIQQITPGPSGELPYLDITVGTTHRNAVLTGGFDSEHLTFSYTVAAGDNDPDGPVVASQIVLNGSTMRDPAGNDLILNLPAGDYSGVIIDAVAPNFTSVDVPNNAYYKEGDVLNFKVHASENVNITGTPYIPVTIGGTIVHAALTGGSGSNTLTFAYTVVSGDNDDDGIQLAGALELNGGTIKDAAGNDADLTFQHVDPTNQVLVNTVIPSVTLTSSSPALVNAPFVLRVTFSEPVFVFQASDVHILAGTATVGTPAQAGGGPAIYDMLITPTADGLVVLEVPANVVANLAGNPNSASGPLGRTYDGTAPVVNNVTLPTGVYKLGDVLTFTIATSETVNVTGAPYLGVDIGGQNRQAGYVSGTGTNSLTFSYTIQSTDLDLDGPTLASALSLNGGTIRDDAGNDLVPAVAGSYPTVIVDGIVPTITSVDAPADKYYHAGEVLELKVHTSETVIVTATPQLSLTIGTTNVQADFNVGSGTNVLTFKYTVQPNEQDMDGIALTALVLNSGIITDGAGNDLVLALNGVGDLTNVRVNTTTPTVNLSTTAPAVVNAPFTVTATFSEEVFGFTAAGVHITNGTVSNLNTTDGGITYTMLITPSGDGPVIVSVPPGAANNIGRNPNSGSGDVNVTYDHMPPQITIVAVPVTDTYKAGDILDFIVRYHEIVVVNGTPVLPFVMNSGNGQAGFVGGSGTTDLHFSYTVQSGDNDPDGITLGTALELAGGTIKDIAGNDANLTLNGVGVSVVKIDAVAPVVTSVEVPADGYHKAGEVLTFKVHTSEATDVTGAPTIDVTIGTAVKQLVLTSGAGTDLLNFTYTVQPGDKDMDGIQPAGIIALNAGGSLKDVNGNDMVLTLNNVDPTAGVFVNTDIPSVTLSAPQPLVNGFFEVTATFSEKVTGFAATDLDVTNATASNLNTSDDGITYTILITPTGGNITMTVPAGVAFNIGGNPNTASSSLTVTFDGTGPAITAVDKPSTATYKAGDVLNFDVHYNETVTVTGTPQLDIIMTSRNGQATYTGGTGTNTLRFSYTVVPGDLDADGIALGANLQLAGGTIKDPAGNDALLVLNNISANVVKIDATSPVVASVGAPLPGYYKNGNDLFFTVYFSETVTVTGSPVLEVLIGSATREATVTATSANSLTFHYNILPGDQDLDGIELAPDLKLNGATIRDAIGNDALLTLHNVPNTSTVYVYSIVPAVTFSGIVTNAPFTLSVIFSEKVTGFDISDIQVTNATLTNFATTDNITYTMTLTPAAQGTVTIKVPANAAVNVAGTGNAASSGISYYYDGTPPAISSVDVPANKYYKAGDVLPFTVHYSETVNVMASAPQEIQLPLILDGKTVYANFVSGGGTNGDLLFNYTVVDGDMDLDGINLGTALILHSGWIRDASANNAVLTLNGVANTSGVRINTAKPSVQIVSAAAARVNAPFTATITFSEAVTGFATTGITAVNATVSNLQTSDNTVYTLTVTPGTDGLLNLSVPANVAVNNGGNNNTASGNLARTVDKTAPVINTQTLTVNNNEPVGTTVGTITATDASNVFQDWTITSDPSGGAFAMDNATGKITVKNASLLDAKAGTTVVLGVTVSDGLNTSGATAIPINVILAFVNKTPTLDAISNVSVCTGTDVHTIQLTGASAVEAGQTYTITATSNQPYFDALSVSTAGVLSYQLKSTVTTGTATITVTIKDDGGTANGAVDQLSRTFTITVNNLPAITINSDKGNSVSKGDVIHLTATGASTYSWTNIDGIISGQQTAVLEAKAKDNATYEVTATSAAGCIGTASISITVIEDFKVDATNILTPNGDGRNDKWVIRNLDSYPNNEVQVFDRSGRIVFQQRNYANDWLGTLNGKPLAEGTYYYILRINDGAKTAKGYITIIRDEQ
ncbi:T9SS type B sorting domain-containing protein [Chitinophaga agrisoli]|uniref:T9SS type B sorting domain-containing protein n=1 Tax=Chitinophaga agrisoli TaxID=2607653 RepID=A0A5B2VJY2_9BACT|nr:Ig-like domain-containing protein [Chitinophaga agrisoli]KAA2238900.1 T9SS type B sorting domain-containing protein [Chitinophaga agrisoli]